VSLFGRLRARLSRTRQTLADGIAGVLAGGRALDDSALEELLELLYTADLGPVASEVVGELARQHKRGEISGPDEVRGALGAALRGKLQPDAVAIPLSGQPTVILVVGVNGSGKTTTVARLAHRLKAEGNQVLLGACDTFRAAAADQLEIWAERVGVHCIRGQEGADPASVAFSTLEAAEAGQADVVLLDTAGRLHTQHDLMDELSKVNRVLGRRIEGAPHSVLLVLDGTNGQNAVQQARLFTDAVPVTGLIVAKLDGTARGGAVFTISDELGLPVHYIGTGESAEDLEPFDPDAFVEAIIA